MDRWKAKRQTEAPSEPEVEMEIESEEPASDQPLSVEAMLASWDIYKEEAKRDKELNMQAVVFGAWKDMRAYRMEEEEDARQQRERALDRHRTIQHLMDHSFVLQQQLADMEVRTGVRRRAVNRADYPAPAWSPARHLPYCDCAEDCVGQCIAKMS